MSTPTTIVRGFEVEKGRYVPLEDEDLDRLDVELTKTIDICDFVVLEEIDPIYFRKAYYLLPAGGRREAVPPARAGARGDRQVAIAKIVIRNKQHLACCARWNGTLVLETMYYADEVREPEKVDGEREPAQARGRDGEVARREPERRVRSREVRRHLPQGAARRSCGPRRQGKPLPGARSRRKRARSST